ncbi:MAG: DUF2207 domain-containing protein [Erysipelotrichaceae bacterium]|nr:DUF2207 domain-containing protein [Erysipelotrichaceae bacterium]
MRKFISVFLAACTVAAVLFSTSLTAFAKEGFDIVNHTVEMEVHEDGSILVSETMNVHFTQQLHGIYVNIPRKYNMTWEINGEKKYRTYDFPVIHPKILSDHKCEIKRFSDGVQFKIGSAKSYAAEYETYKFQYQIVTRDLDLDGLQMFFMNITSGKWNTVTESVNFRISMPKNFDANRLQFSSPVGVTPGSKGPLNVEVIGNTISGSYDEPLKAGQAITVQLTLPDNYYVFPDMNSYARTSMALGVAVTIIMAIVFFIFGKDDPLIETVEFHAPSGITSAEVGVIIDGEANDSDVISLILDWGRRGLITIKEEEKNLVLEKINDLEASSRGYEKTLFNRIFKKGDRVTVESLKSKLYSTIYKTEQQLDKYFTGNRSLVTTESLCLQILGVIVSSLPLVLYTAFVSYRYRYDGGVTFISCFGIAIMITLCSVLMIRIDKKRFQYRWYTSLFIWLGAAVLFAVAFIIALVHTIKASVNPLYLIVTAAFNMVLLVEVMLMKKRTAYASELLGQVLGLRNFIIYAEQDRLQMLLEENPYYFYDILPYAYALGLTDIWNDHFKNLTIEPCTWYYSQAYTDHYHMMHSLESHMTIIEESFTVAPPSSSSGGGSFGSSGSSGGFSGGGFGGSSGGGW